MKVFNLTDVSTPALVAQGLVGQQIVVGAQLLPPGGFAEVEDTHHRRQQLASMVALGALSIDKLPPAYIRAKSDMAPPPPPPPAPEPPKVEPAPTETEYLFNPDSFSVGDASLSFENPSPRERVELTQADIGTLSITEEGSLQIVPSEPTAESPVEITEEPRTENKKKGKKRS